MSSIYWHQICSAERCCTATVESVTNAVTVFAREWVNKFCVAQIKKTGTKSHGNSTEPRRHYGTCSEKQSFICDFNLGLWNLEQILRNVKLIVYSGLNGNVGALVGPLFLAFWECAAVILPPYWVASFVWSSWSKWGVKKPSFVLQGSMESSQKRIQKKRKKKFGSPGYQRMSFPASPTHIICQDSKSVILREQWKGM